MKRLHWILLLMILLIPTESISAKKKTEKSDREIWCDVMSVSYTHLTLPTIA